MGGQRGFVALGLGSPCVGEHVGRCFAAHSLFKFLNFAFTGMLVEFRVVSVLVVAYSVSKGDEFTHGVRLASGLGVVFRLDGGGDVLIVNGVESAKVLEDVGAVRLFVCSFRIVVTVERSRTGFSRP